MKSTEKSSSFHVDPFGDLDKDSNHTSNQIFERMGDTNDFFLDNLSSSNLNDIDIQSSGWNSRLNEKNETFSMNNMMEDHGHTEEYFKEDTSNFFGGTNPQPEQWGQQDLQHTAPRRAHRHPKRHRSDKHKTFGGFSMQQFMDVSFIQNKNFDFSTWDGDSLRAPKKPLISSGPTEKENKEFTNASFIATLSRYITNNQFHEFKHTVEKNISNPAVDWNAKNEHGATLLIWAIIEDRIEFVDYLQKMKICDPNGVDDDGNTPLSVAICNNRVHIVHLMLSNDSSIQINHPDEEGNTPLHDACRMNSTNIVKILLAAGADVNARNNDGLLPIDLCTDLETRACFRGPISPVDQSAFPSPVHATMQNMGRGGNFGFGQGDISTGYPNPSRMQSSRSSSRKEDLSQLFDSFVINYDFGAQPPNGPIEEVLQWERSRREKLEAICLELQTQLNTLRNKLIH